MLLGAGIGWMVRTIQETGGGRCTAAVAVSHGSAGKGEACLAAPGEPKSLSCLGQAARDRPLPGNLECVGPASPAVGLGGAGRAALGGPGDSLVSGMEGAAEGVVRVD